MRLSHTLGLKRFAGSTQDLVTDTADVLVESAGVCTSFLNHKNVGRHGPTGLVTNHDATIVQASRGLEQLVDCILAVPVTSLVHQFDLSLDLREELLVALATRAHTRELASQAEAGCAAEVVAALLTSGWLCCCLCLGVVLCVECHDKSLV